MAKVTKKNKLSVIILYGGDVDQDIYKRCLSSVKFADEIIKIDTKNIKGSFSEWRNEGLKRARGDWVLYVDTDEIVSEKLKIEILNVLNSSLVTRNSQTARPVAYAIPRKNYIFGKEFKYSGQYPDYQKRLFRRDALKRWSGKVHEEPVFEGKMGHLKESLLHYKNMTISQMIEKTNKWSEIEAQLMVDANHPKMNFLRFFSAGFREFFKRFIKEKAFLDGREGVIYGIYQIYSRLISYSKLWEIQLNKSN